MTFSPDPKPHKRIRAGSREWRLLRAEKLNGQGCRICARSAETIHHVVPKSQSGDDLADNVVPLCGDGTRGCHGLIEAHDADARYALYLALTPAEKTYAEQRMGSGWLERSYGTRSPALSHAVERGGG